MIWVIFHEWWFGLWHRARESNYQWGSGDGSVLMTRVLALSMLPTEQQGLQCVMLRVKIRPGLFWTCAKQLAFKPPHFSITVTFLAPQNGCPAGLHRRRIPKSQKSSSLAHRVSSNRQSPRFTPPPRTTHWSRQRDLLLSTKKALYRNESSTHYVIKRRRLPCEAPGPRLLPRVGRRAGNRETTVRQYAEIIKHGETSDQHCEANVHRDKSKWSCTYF